MFKIVIPLYERLDLVFAVGVYLCHFSFTQDCVRLEFPKYVFSARWNWLNIKEMISRERENRGRTETPGLLAQLALHTPTDAGATGADVQTEHSHRQHAGHGQQLHCEQWGQACIVDSEHSHPLWTVRTINRRRQLWQSSTADRTDNHSLCTVWTLVLCA